ncbi:hypothetical protein BJ741DRAFT_605333 [Chytriomyces cf. hyalinus JEL632]|nr:hypothetical protein BJ741DRAFT_605333 [Chytriomyces cf. hyalinus JEL632]
MSHSDTHTTNPATSLYSLCRNSTLFRRKNTYPGSSSSIPVFLPKRILEGFNVTPSQSSNRNALGGYETFVIGVAVLVVLVLAEIISGGCFVVCLFERLLLLLRGTSSASSRTISVNIIGPGLVRAFGVTENKRHEDPARLQTGHVYIRLSVTLNAHSMRSWLKHVRHSRPWQQGSVNEAPEGKKAVRICKQRLCVCVKARQNANQHQDCCSRYSTAPARPCPSMTARRTCLLGVRIVWRWELPDANFSVEQKLFVGMEEGIQVSEYRSVRKRMCWCLVSLRCLMSAP